MMKIALVTNIPAPYRIPIYKEIARLPDISLQVIFCSEREPNRFWNLPPLEFSHVFLKKRFATVNDRYIHNNPDVFGRLKEFAPDVVVIDGFNPTHLYACLYAFLNRVPYVPMTDGTYESERSLSLLHRMARRFIYTKTCAFVYASLGGKKLYQSYGVPAEQCFQSHLCIDNEAFRPTSSNITKQYDFIFCGRIEAVKNPLFALNVAAEVAKKLNRKVSILYVGAGSQLEMVKAGASSRSDLVEATFHHHATQEELPALYQSARIFLFPTLWDPWGVVANEACAAGLPVMVSSYAGVAGELVLDNHNGFICDLDIHVWAERATRLLCDPALWEAFSQRSSSLVGQYNFTDAAEGLISACRYAKNDCLPLVQAKL